MCIMQYNYSSHRTVWNLANTKWGESRWFPDKHYDYESSPETNKNLFCIAVWKVPEQLQLASYFSPVLNEICIECRFSLCWIKAEHVWWTFAKTCSPLAACRSLTTMRSMSGQGSWTYPSLKPSFWSKENELRSKLYRLLINYYFYIFYYNMK